MTTTNEMPAAPSRQLTRSKDDRVLAGVCSGLARYVDVDPVIFRVLVAVLSVFGGAGIVLYIIGWLLIPEAGRPTSEAESLLGRVQGRPIAQVAFAAVAVAVTLGVVHDGNGAALVLGGLALVAFLVLRNRSAYAGAAEPLATTPAGSTISADHLATSGSAATTPDAWAPRTPRPRSALGLLTTSAVLLVLGVLLALDAGDLVNVTAKSALAAALLVLGGGLVVGARVGAARWLIAPAVVLVLLLGALQVVGVPLRGGTGDRLWQAGSSAELRTPYRLAAGTAHLDLSGLVATDRIARVVASVGAGRLVVTVPQDATVTVHGHAGVGNVEIFGIEDAGLAADRDVTAGGTSPGSLDLDLAVGIGEVVVARASA